MDVKRTRPKQFLAQCFFMAIESAVGIVLNLGLLAGAAWSDTTAPQAGIDLSRWNLTLPVGTPGHPTVVPTNELLGRYNSKFFHVEADGAIVFWCPVSGVTTAGSSYARSELRETRPDGTLYNWNVENGTATLNATLAVNQVPGSGKVVVGQIHDNGAGGIKNEPLLKLLYRYDAASGAGSLVAQVRPTPTSTINNEFILATSIKLNRKFTYTVQLRADLTLSVQVDGVTRYRRPIDPSWKNQGMYFKAGAYVQDHVESDTEGTRISFYALTATHN